MSRIITALVSTVAALAVLSLIALSDAGSASAGGTPWGDFDCSGSVTPVDSLKTLRKDAGLSVSQEPGCLSPGARIMVGGSPRLWGDVDCANGLNPVDSLKLLRFDAGLLGGSTISGGAACPDIGSSVTAMPIVLIDASHDGGGWWFPQPPGSEDPDQPHQGKPLADYLRTLGFAVDEWPRGLTVTPEALDGHELIVRAGDFLDYLPSELDAYESYVQRGGNLLLLTDFQRPPGEMDSLADVFGVGFKGITRDSLVVDTFAESPITDGVTSYAWGVGSGIVEYPDSAVIDGWLSEDGYLDLNDNSVQDTNEPSGPAVIGHMPYGSGRIVFVGDINGIEGVPQPLTSNIVGWLLGVAPPPVVTPTPPPLPPTNPEGVLFAGGLSAIPAASTLPSSISSLSVGSATIPPGETVTIDVTAEATNFGGYRIDVQYDSSLVSAISCVSNFSGPPPTACSIDVVASDTVRMSGSDIFGITGTVGTITFLAGSTEGTAALTVNPNTLFLIDTLAQTLVVTPTNGAITIDAAAPSPGPSPSQAPTPTPTLMVTPTATPTATPIPTDPPSTTPMLTPTPTPTATPTATPISSPTPAQATDAPAETPHPTSPPATTSASPSPTSSAPPAATTPTQATDAPTETPAPTPTDLSATETPGSLPTSGGPAGESGSSMLVLTLGLLFLAIFVAAWRLSVHIELSELPRWPIARRSGTAPRWDWE